jgi:hypothetical protein
LLEMGIETLNGMCWLCTILAREDRFEECMPWGELVRLTGVSWDVVVG